MVQSNAIINYLNTANFIYNHTNSNNKIWVLFSKNAHIFLAGRYKGFYDKFNIHITGFKQNSKFLKCDLSQLIGSFFLYQWLHMGFRGKSYRIRNFCRVNKFTFNLGYSHWTKLKLLNNWGFYKRRRQNYVIYSFFFKDFLFFKRFLPYIRFYNCYTMRGLRLRKQPIIRRFGKISQHISSLH